MVDDLAAVRLKLERAQEHADALHTAISGFLWRDAYDAVVKLNEQANSLDVVMIVRDSPPMRWGPMFGDFVHNLRSALDHLAIALVLRNEPTANIDKTAFPMFSQDPLRPDAPPAEKAAWKRRVRGMGADHVAAVKAVQPFNNPPPRGKVETLTILNALSNADKHKRLIPLNGVAGDHVTLIPRKLKGWHLDRTTAEIPVGPVEHGAVIASFRISPLEANPDMDMEIGVQLGVAVTLEEGVPMGTDMDVALRILYTRVLDIVNDFERRFFR